MKGIDENELKAFAKEAGADLVGIASIDRFEGAPPENHPGAIMPNAKSVVVLGCRIGKGLLLAIGRNWWPYNAYGYGGLGILMRPVIYSVMKYIEDQGHTVIPIDPMSAVLMMAPQYSVLNHRYAAVAAGLGEIGYSKLFLSPKFGPRQRLASLITTASLRPDPLFEGEICDRCMRCVEKCPAGAISKDDRISFSIAGKKVEFGKLDTAKCTFYHHGLSKKVSPFVEHEIPFSEKWSRQDVMRLHGRGFGYRGFSGLFGTNAMCGARGCMTACLRHLEKTGRIKCRTAAVSTPWLP